MSSVNITNARKDLYKIVDSVNQSHEPIYITGKKNSAVLIAEDDWKSIEETLFLMSIPGMRQSIIDGMKTSKDELETKLDW